MQTIRHRKDFKRLKGSKTVDLCNAGRVTGSSQRLKLFIGPQSDKLSLNGDVVVMSSSNSKGTTQSEQ